MKIIASFIAIVGIIAGVFYLNHSHASVTSFTIAPSSLGTDDVVAKTSAAYDVEYVVPASSFDANSTLSQIVVTFPSGYVITDGTLDPTTALDSSTQSTCTAQPGFLCFNGDDSWDEVTGMTGSSSARTITITFAGIDMKVVNHYTTDFRILQGIQNPTTAENISPSGIAVGAFPASAWNSFNKMVIDDDVTGNDETLISNSFDLIAGPADHLTFTQQPAGSAPNGDFTTDTAFPTEPIVEVRDQYENIVTSYNDCVNLSAGDGMNTTLYSLNSLPGSYSCLTLPGSGSLAMTAVDGVADFTGTGLAYFTATDDHASFQITAAASAMTSALSVSLVPDAVASQLVWTQDFGGCSSGAVCNTQGIIEAQDPFNVTDADYSSSVKLSLTGAGSIVGNATQSLVNGILNIIGVGYTNSDPSVDETTAWVGDDGAFSSQGADVVVAAAGATPPPPTPPTPTPTASPILHEAIGATATNPNPAEIPGTVATNAVAPTPTTSPASCSPYLKTYMRLGARNGEVSKLQTFLAKLGFFSAAPTGFFGKVTENAVKLFQEKYTQDVLKYWGLNKGTGYVYITTQKKINEISCAGGI